MIFTVAVHKCCCYILLVICFYSSLYYRLVGPLEVARLFNGEVGA